jgi:beta-xylosidase
MNSKVLAKTALSPEGPWSDPVTLYQATPITSGSSIYAAVPHPYHDPTGKSLLVTFTNHPNVIQAIKVVCALPLIVSRKLIWM